jgi:uncharacterized membrane protein YgcG
MRKPFRRWWQVLLVLPVFLLLAAGMSPLPRGSVSAAPEASCAGPVVGQRIYDCAGVLTASEIAYLETQAAAVERAGAPTVVYLQVHAATAPETLQDAIDLMNRWNVESHPGARDGFVMFFNVQPGNLRHGQVALYAGEKHFQNGNLPQSELDRIRADVMTPLLAQGQTAAGIAAGLQMVAHDLQYGPPPPPAYQQVAATLGRLPISLLGLLFVAVVAFLFVRLSRLSPPSSAGDEVGGRQAPASPGDLPPAMAGALLAGRVNDSQVEGTVLDFARRGLLVMEPIGRNKVQVRLLGNGTSVSSLSGYEQDTWQSLASLAGSEQGTIGSTELTHLRQDWGEVRRELRRELTEKGWYDPETAGLRRRPLYLAGIVGMVGAAIALVLMVASKEGWATIGLALFFGAGLAAFIRGYSVPDSTVEGEIAAAPWRAYRDSVSAREYQPNLDTDLPYIVALGIVNKLAPRLKAASERGYSPSWFHGLGSEEPRQGWNTTVVGFYPYWVAFHASAAPASASGGYAGGGAAAGGGGSAGGY